MEPYFVLYENIPFGIRNLEYQIPLYPLNFPTGRRLFGIPSRRISIRNLSIFRGRDRRRQTTYLNLILQQLGTLIDKKLYTAIWPSKNLMKGMIKLNQLT